MLTLTRRLSLILSAVLTASLLMTATPARADVYPTPGPFTGKTPPATLEEALVVISNMAAELTSAYESRHASERLAASCEREVDRLQYALDFETLRRTVADDRSVISQTAHVQAVVENDRLKNEARTLKADLAEAYGIASRERRHAERMADRVERLRAKVAGLRDRLASRR